VRIARRSFLACIVEGTEALGEQEEPSGTVSRLLMVFPQVRLAARRLRSRPSDWIIKVLARDSDL
jgi:hypothetical protein